MPDKNDQWEDNIGGFSIVAGKKEFPFMSIESVLFVQCVLILHPIIFA